jgi:hypothetical protein
MEAVPRTLERRGLAKGLKIWLDIVFYLLIAAGFIVVVLWPILSMAGEDQFQISVPVAFEEEALFPDHGVEGLSFHEVRGKLELVTTQFSPNALFWILTLAFVSAAVYGLLLVRSILRTTIEGHPFHPRNPRRLNHLGWIMVGTSLLASLASFLFGLWARSQLQGSELPLASTFQGYGEWLLCGLFILVLAAVWKEAVRIAEEQSLTV